jgi:hypothetical protein
MPVSVLAATTSVIPPSAASVSPALMVRSGAPYFYVFTDENLLEVRFMSLLFFPIYVVPAGYL